MTVPTLTPMMSQYQTMRKSLPDDVILFYRLGDFYEMFFEDAKVAAPILNVALTKRGGIPMCGIPFHAAQGYLARLLKDGKRVAIAEQTSDPQPGKLVQREIARILSPGSIDDLTLLDDQKPNYLAAICQIGKRYGFAYIDHTTGEFVVAEYDNRSGIDDEMARVCASELIYPDHQAGQFAEIKNSISYDGYAFLPDQASQAIKEQFRIQSLDGYGLSGSIAAVAAAGAVLHYLTYQLRRSCEHLRSPHLLIDDQFVLIDAASQRNLDLVESRGGKANTLLGVLDRTLTPMGGRLLRSWLLHPLRDRKALMQRQEVIAAFLSEPFLLTKCRESMRGIRDMERVSSRLSQGTGNPRDLSSLAKSIDHLPALKEDLLALKNGDHLLSKLHDFSALSTLLMNALAEELPANLRDGGVIRDGYSAELDSLRSASVEGKNWMAELQESERHRTGIDSLKIKFNNVFGYFIEISTAKLAKVPDDYTRKQTMANAERYITPALKEMENKILGADERSKRLEQELFLVLRQQAISYLIELQESAAAVAEVDALGSLAEVAQFHRHTRPILEESTRFSLSNARHPVLEQTLTQSKFVPNDTEFDPESSRVHLITGPNMAGKSTYIRQVALIQLMAQIGAYVPADQAIIGLADRIFCRVGASDDLSRGQSTFMVEMSETALILNHATSKSLVILDEIGRGTATFDGLSIAWAVAEHLHDEIGCRTLFATHYHELTDLSVSKLAVENFNVAVREWNEEIIFLHKVLPGAADKSYGIQVARLAGLPVTVLDRAKAILAHLEFNSSKPENAKRERGPRPTSPLENILPLSNSPQLDWFSDF